MHVVMLSDIETLGGAARAAYRLHTGLRRIVVESQMLVQVKSSDGFFGNIAFFTLLYGLELIT